VEENEKPYPLRVLPFEKKGRAWSAGIYTINEVCSKLEILDKNNKI